MNFNSIFKKQNRQKGFTMVETLVAIFILMLSITAPLYFVNSALQASYYSRDQITAFYLAQESIELIKNIRDNNSLRCANNQWLTSCTGQSDNRSVIDLSPCISGTCYIHFDFTTSGPSLCTSDCDYMEETTINDFIVYGYGSDSVWSDTKFQREVQITQVTDKSALVNVEITWKSGTVQRNFRVNQLITNWIPI